MGHGAKIIAGHIDGFREEIQRLSTKDRPMFFNWFDESGGDVDTTFVRGQCEFAFSILLPLQKLLRETKRHTALEIGYGGGRLIAAAAQVFQQVIGVDVHGRADIVADELRRRHISNVELLIGNGHQIPVRAGEIDLVYSFIVFQHLEYISIFEGYLNETYRVLKRGGYAVLFFGRLSFLSRNTRSVFLHFVDQVLEVLHPSGYRELPAQVNRTNLRVSARYARMKAQAAGFRVIQQGVSRKLPDYHVYGGQNFLVLTK